MVHSQASGSMMRSVTYQHCECFLSRARLRSSFPASPCVNIKERERGDIAKYLCMYMCVCVCVCASLCSFAFVRFDYLPCIVVYSFVLNVA